MLHSSEISSHLANKLPIGTTSEEKQFSKAILKAVNFNLKTKDFQMTDLSVFFSAEKFLTFAFERCHRSCRTNKRLILIYLIPVKMLLVFIRFIYANLSIYIFNHCEKMRALISFSAGTPSFSSFAPEI